jgi:transmembrane sensor
MTEPTNGSSDDPRLHDRMNQIAWNSLDRYFSGEASANESAEIDRSDPTFVDSVREIWDAAGVITTPAAPDVEAAWSALSPRLTVPAPSARSEPRPLALLRPRKPRGRLIPILLASAAAFLGVVAIKSTFDSRNTQSTAADVGERVFATRKAQRADLYLSDGTRVILNVDSRLRVPANYGKTSRIVSLDGEAFFEVVDDSARPFRVSTAAGVAEDLGTAFIVSHYAEMRGMRVGVSSGSVIVRRDTAGATGTILNRGDLARVGPDGRVTVRRNVNMDDELAWTTGKLVFDRVPLRDVVPRLARWFDADIKLGDSTLNDVRYTGTFRNEPIAHVLELLAASLDASIERELTAYVLLSR